MKKIISFLLIIVILAAFSGCEYYEGKKKISGVSYESEIFNGTQNNEAYNGIRGYTSVAKISYYENTVKEDFEKNLLTIIGEGHDFIWCLEKGSAETLLKTAPDYPQKKFAVIDAVFDKIPENVITLNFRDQEAGFIAGYIAAKASLTKTVGYLVANDFIGDKYEAGFIAGANYAANEDGFSVKVESVKLDSEHNRESAKAGAEQLYTEKQCDLIFTALQTGTYGAIDTAKAYNSKIICAGVDFGSSAPENVLVSVIKNVKIATSNITSAYTEKTLEFGKNYEFGAKERMISLSKVNNLDKTILDKANKIRLSIADEKITPPKNQEELEKFLSELAPVAE